MRSGAPLYDPWVTLAYVAAATERIRLGTSVYVLPLRHPIVSARAITTLDVLSGGRVEVGIGMGWLREEFEAVGESFDRRGRRADEIVEILRRLWTEREIEHHGEFYDFAPLRFEPKPVQDPHPPIVVGGESAAALRRAARLGDGWISSGNQTLDELGSSIEALRTLRSEMGRTEHRFEATAFNRLPIDAQHFDQHRALGVDRLVVMPTLPTSSPQGRLSLEDALRFVDDCGKVITASD